MKISGLSEKLYLLIQDFFSFCSGGSFCIGCGKKTLSLPVCKECRNLLRNIAAFNQYRCKNCGKILISEIEICTECRENQKKQKYISAFFPLHSYRLWKKDLMYTWKTENVRSFSSFFAELIYSSIKQIKEENGLDFDSIVPVPPRPGKIQKKGWDQVDELCKILKRRYNFNVEYALERYSGQEQKKLNKEERKNKQQNEYGLKKGDCLKAKKVLLLDDVITTGATMEECSKLLLKAGAQNVYGMSLFIVD